MRTEERTPRGAAIIGGGSAEAPTIPLDF